jgi:hypothetical protein
MREPATEKRNQHYVPRFHLRRFCVDGNDRVIRLFNIKNQKFVLRANLYNQASHDYYYGKDGFVEDQLQIMEGIFAMMIDKIVTSNQLPKHNSEEFENLMSFFVITDLRNPVSKDSMLGSMKAVTDLLMKDGNDEIKAAFKGQVPELNNPGAFQLQYARDIIPILLDLDVKLIDNKTIVPFILSDNPTVKYNQFFEDKPKPNSSSGYGHEGLQIFVPLTPRYSVIAYDSRMYHVGSRKGKTVTITNPEDVHQLNLLQFLNAYRNVFGNEQLTERYIMDLSKRSQDFEKPNKPISKLFPVEGNPQEKILMVSDSELRTKLKLSFTFLSTYAFRFTLTDRAVYPRDYSLKVHQGIAQGLRRKANRI